MASVSDRAGAGAGTGIRARLLPLRFDPSERDRIARFAEAAYPSETCGLLFGTREPGGDVRVTRAVRVPNAAVSRTESYRFAADGPGSASRPGGGSEEVLGAWHSHPDRPPRPSARDLEGADPDLLYVAVSVRAGRAGARCAWRVTSAPAVRSPA